MSTSPSVKETFWSPELEHRWNALLNKIDPSAKSDVTDRLRSVIEPWQSADPPLVIAFCGLFSAGKSSLLNALTDGALATGAVPTTATVETVSLPDSEHPVLLMDTPGIDSTDSAHEEATLASLYRADVVALVMDYQHVEADEHLEWARRCTEEGQRLLLIVHQVDKHFDWELPFAEYRDRVENSFREFGVSYERIFYTSVDPSVHSELSALSDYLHELALEPLESRFQSVRNRVRLLIRELVRQRHEEEVTEATEQLQTAFGVVPNDVNEALAWLQERQDQQSEWAAKRAERLRNIEELFAQQFSDVKRVVELAQITPYETAELGRRYIESLLPGFHVGWFGKAEKTAQERQTRLHEFVSQLIEHAEKNLFWPVRSAVRGFLQEHAEWLEFADVELDGLEMTISEEMVAAEVKSGALVSAEYGYQFVRDVVSAIRRQMTARVQAVFDDFRRRAMDVESAKAVPDEDESVTIQAEVKALEEWMDVHRRIETEVEDWMNLWTPEEEVVSP
ncbi:MAG: dynamin family protein [Alicyclobacillaceae bacterium]|nr:dynamin family protein [Alicyclobacillaceae bacterium]